MESLDLRRNNLYANGSAIYFPKTKEYLLVREILTFTPSTGDKYHIVTDGERLDLLAWRFYKDEVPDPSKYWWAIADANNIYNPFDLSEWVGKNILIPDIQQVKLKV